MILLMANNGQASPVPRGRPAVGPQVRYWRRRRGLTLAQVAERAGMNGGYLSQVENDKASPSLETLAAVGAALDVPITWFLVDATPPPRVVRAAERPVTRMPGSGVSEEVDGGLARDLRLMQFTGQPGGTSGLQAHMGEEHHLVLAGRLRCSQGEHVVELGPGDYLVWDAALPHEVETIGGDPCTALVITHRPHATGSAAPEG